MRIVLDTNVFLAGLLWLGPPHRILELAEESDIALCTSEALLEELEQVLRRPKFRNALARRQVTVEELMGLVLGSVEIFEPTPIRQIMELRDPDNVIVFECAMIARAEYIVSGDDDLLALKYFQRTPILAPAEFVQLVEAK